MTRNESIAIIKDYLSKQPVEWVGIFGSFARNEMRAESDIDVVVQFKKDARVTLFDYVRYKQTLEELLGRKVDLATYKYFHPKLKDRIAEELHIIYTTA